MCGRFVSMTDPDGLVRFFVVDERKGEALGANPNVAPTEPVYAVAQHDDRRLLVTFRWGLVPHWATDRRSASRMINARAETAASKPAFRRALERRRCIVPADGFYEWGHGPDGRKAPHYIHHRDDSPLALAALWETWRDPRDPDAGLLRTCAILTTSANDTLRGLHDRMPVILARESWDRWLARDLREPEALRDLLAPYPSWLMAKHEVSSDVNDARVKHPGLPAPVAT
jgi:putative SOS response-associated peptidase YedK